MTRFKVWCGASLLLAVVVFVAMSLVQAATAAPPPLPPPPPPVHSTFQITQTYLPGGPAVPVHTTNGATANHASIAAFSQDDVIAFLNQHGFYAGPVIQGVHLKIVSIQFVTAEQASNLMYGESVGRPDNYLVCYVKVQGPFMLTNVHAGPHLPNRKNMTTAEFGDMVFDGHTGNILVWGVY